MTEQNKKYVLRIEVEITASDDKGAESQMNEVVEAVNFCSEDYENDRLIRFAMTVSNDGFNDPEVGDYLDSLIEDCLEPAIKKYNLQGRNKK